MHVNVHRSIWQVNAQLPIDERLQSAELAYVAILSVLRFSGFYMPGKTSKFHTFKPSTLGRFGGC